MDYTASEVIDLVRDRYNLNNAFNNNAIKEQVRRLVAGILTAVMSEAGEVKYSKRQSFH